MARYTGPRGRRSRRAGIPLGLKLRDERTKYDLETAPGGHRPRRATDYGVRQREVQRVKWYYGILDRQFRRYYREAERRPGDTGLHLLRMLEMRLDNVVYHLRFAVTRAQARQLVSHGHVRVNGRRAKTPSMLLAPGDTIDLDVRTKPRAKEALDLTKDRPVPAWVALDETSLSGAVLREPGEHDVPALFDRRLVVELMARG